MVNDQGFNKQLLHHLFGIVAVDNAILIGSWWVTSKVLGLNSTWVVIFLIIIGTGAAFILAYGSVKIIAAPIHMITQAILHVSPDEPGITAPDPNGLLLGRDLITELCTKVYRIASVVDTITKDHAPKPNLHANFIAHRLPLPLIVLDKKLNVVFVNEAALKYLKITSDEIIGKSMYSKLDLLFTNMPTFDSWLSYARLNSVTDQKTWERVRIKLADQETVRQFDLAAYYNKDNPAGFEVLLTMFDHSRMYEQDDQAMNFVALAVHELRTPVTLLRGYIEVFEEELDGKLDDELIDFMHKMEVAARDLSSFVNNILNVARVDNEHLILELHEEKWDEVLDSAIKGRVLQAKVHDIAIESAIDHDLPVVGVDRASIYEVINNLIDNAIKYSGGSKKIVVRSYATKDGFVETTIQDFGVGIPSGVMPNLFDKFYRGHRQRSQIGGTGLGLYLSKAIIEAHGGNIWVRSKEGEGSTFGFTIVPYSRLAETQKNTDNSDIVRNAHGWIKNHSLYRR